MAIQQLFRSGTTTEHSTFTGAATEVTLDTTKQTLVVHDGSTVGGFPLLRQNLTNSAAWSSTAKNILPVPVTETNFAKFYHQVLNADGVWRAQTAKILTSSATSYILGSNAGTYVGGTATGDVYDAEAYIRFTGAITEITVPLNSTTAFPIGTTISGICVTGTQCFIKPATTGVNINGITATTGIGLRSAQYVSFVLTKWGTDTWDLAGDLA